MPLIVDGPGLAKRRVLDTPVINTDWLPTLLELAGVRAHGPLDGISQAKLLRSGRPSSGTRPYFWHIPHYTNQGSRRFVAFRSAARRRRGVESGGSGANG